MCEYVFKNGEKCKEDAFEDSKYCILHMPFPDDRNSAEFKHIAKLKERKVQEKVSKGDFNFEGAILLNVDFSNLEIEGNVNFIGAVILENALFNGTAIKGNASFDEAKIKGNASFDEAKIEADAWFDEAEIEADASFNDAEIGGSVWFNDAEISGGVWFNDAEIRESASFNKLNVKEKLSFKNAVFKEPIAEEKACRAARRSYEKFGDRETADGYFLREMRARRKQKNKFTQFLEWLIADASCSYGTNFFKPLGIWIIAVLVVFPIIYYFGHGITSPNPFFPFFKSAAENAKSFLSAEYFSIVTATTLGYGDFQPASTIFRIVASLEAIFGTFMWVIFLTVFARKYMR